MFESILHKATQITEEASQLASSYFRKGVLIEMKENQTPVTVADKNTEIFIREQLKKNFPAHGIWGEEFGADKPDEEFVWTVDPIDGTRSFIRGIPLYGTLLGLMQNQIPIIGIMVLPGLGETFSALKGQGCFCNGQRIHASVQNNIKQAQFAMGDYYAFTETNRTFIHDEFLKTAAIARSYTDCFGHSLVMSGALDGMLDPLVSPWDVVPLVVLIEEAGGFCSDFSGNRIWDKSFVSCSKPLSEPLLQWLSEHK